MSFSFIEQITLFIMILLSIGSFSFEIFKRFIIVSKGTGTFNFDSLGIETNPSQDANPDSNGERSSNPDVPITDDQPNFNDSINGDLIDSLIDQNHFNDYSINDFI